MNLPVVDLTAPMPAKAAEIERACRDSGFFYVTGSSVPEELKGRLDTAAREFFALPEEIKAEIAMEHGGKAWRGFFPVGAELTSGKPDRKEGVYFGTERPGDPRPLHGGNLFPSQVPDLRPAVLDYMNRLTDTAQDVLRAVAVSLGLDEEYFASGYTRDPTVLFRIFHYPPVAGPASPELRSASSPEPDFDDWGVGEHTDYGLLTLLLQDDNGGLAVRTGDGWIDAPPIPGTFVCNIGDMLDRLTGGYYRSTPHRVRNVSGNERLSYPFFFDPDFDKEVPPLPASARKTTDGSDPRWDGEDLRAFAGTYGDYLVNKVSKVFPHLRAELG
jgi:isopenicillin N synthase-like dioxygenase